MSVDQNGDALSGIGGRRRDAIREGKPGYRARRDEVVQTAALIFRELGYEAATLNDVAARLGTDRASLYYYVGSKEELLHEVVRSVLLENVTTAERVQAGGGSPLEKLVSLIREMMESFDRNYPHMFVYIEDLGRIAREDSDWARDVLHSTKRFESIVIAILDEGRESGVFRDDLQSELSAFALFGMVNWTHRWYRPGGKYSPADVANVFAGIFVNGYAL